MALDQPQSDQPGQSPWQPRRVTGPQDQEARRQAKQPKSKGAQEASKAVKGLSAFWAKVNNDWIFNLAAMLAYNLLMSIVPLLAMLLSFFGLQNIFYSIIRSTLC